MRSRESPGVPYFVVPKQQGFIAAIRKLTEKKYFEPLERSSWTALALVMKVVSNANHSLETIGLGLRHPIST